jgi:threonine/homoserine/homoserine lactone efflux protein
MLMSIVPLCAYFGVFRTTPGNTNLATTRQSAGDNAAAAVVVAGGAVNEFGDEEQLSGGMNKLFCLFW